MKRRLYGLAMGFWLLLLMATLALWARGYFAAEGLVIHWEGRTAHAVSVRGGLYFGLFTGFEDLVRNQWVAQEPDDFAGMFPRATAGGGFRFISGEFGEGRKFRAMVIPHWFTAVVAGGAFWLFRKLHRRAPRFTGKRRCSSCGYDIRATPSEGEALLERCPECGLRRAEPSGTAAMAAR